MKTCLLCNHKEPKVDPKERDLPFICSHCVQLLARTHQETLTQRYIEAVKAKRWREAYALYTFVPSKVRRIYPLKKSAIKKIR